MGGVESRDVAAPVGRTDRVSIIVLDAGLTQSHPSTRKKRGGEGGGRSSGAALLEVLPAAAGQRRVRRRVSQAARVVRLQGLGVAAAAAAAVVGRVGQATAAGPLQPTSFLVQVLGLGVQILGRRHRHVRVAARVHLLQVLQTLSQEVL